MARQDSSFGSAHDRVRIGNAERDRAAELLGEHFRAGRLNVVEYDERVGAAYAAQTEADLRPLFVDLPTAQAARAPAPSTIRAWPSQQKNLPIGLRFLQLLGLAVLGVVVVALVIAAIPFVLVGLLIFAKVTGRIGCGQRRHYRGAGGYRGRSWA